MQHKSQDKQKAPCGHPTDHVRLRRRPLMALACNLTLPKLHLATFKNLYDNVYLASFRKKSYKIAFWSD